MEAVDRNREGGQDTHAQEVEENNHLEAFDNDRWANEDDDQNHS